MCWEYNQCHNVCVYVEKYFKKLVGCCFSIYWEEGGGEGREGEGEGEERGGERGRRGGESGRRGGERGRRRGGRRGEGR